MGRPSHSNLRLRDSDVRLSSEAKRDNERIVVAEGKFDVFSQGERGPMWRQCFVDLEDAKRRAQELATEEGLEFFVFSPKDSSEVVRFFPRPGRR